MLALWATVGSPTTVGMRENGDRSGMFRNRDWELCTGFLKGARGLFGDGKRGGAFTVL